MASLYSFRQRFFAHRHIFSFHPRPTPYPRPAAPLPPSPHFAFLGHGFPDPAAAHSGQWAGGARSFAWSSAASWASAKESHEAFHREAGWPHEEVWRQRAKHWEGCHSRWGRHTKKGDGGRRGWSRWSHRDETNGQTRHRSRRENWGAQAINWEAFDGELHKKWHQAHERHHWERHYRWRAHHAHRHAKRRRRFHAAKRALMAFLRSQSARAAWPEWKAGLYNPHLRPYSAASTISLQATQPWTPSTHHPVLRTAPPPTPHTRDPAAFPRKTSLLAFPFAAFAPHSPVNARLLSTSAKAVRFRCPRLVDILPSLVPLAKVLKSTAALNALATFSRVVLTLLPLSLRSKVIHVMRERYLRDPGNASPFIKRIMEVGGFATRNAFDRLNSEYFLPLLVSLPVVFLALVVAASHERTPITGRGRIVMLSPEEEAELVSSVFATDGAANPDWVSILSGILNLGDEGVSANGRRVFLGGEVLDQHDWRVRWAEAVLMALEEKIADIATTGTCSMLDASFRPPPSEYPLSARLPSGDQASIKADYDVLVIDRPDEANAFSFGFGPDEVTSNGRRGVIVIFSGFLNSIVGLKGVPADTPTPTLPSPSQTKSLAVLLSHELAHLVLSHPLESYASSSLFIPHISRMLSDVFRTFIFPVTMILGPFVQDAIRTSFTAGAVDGFGALSHVVNSCESRILEAEADMVALRILAHAGIDPRFALQWWENQLHLPVAATASHSHTPPPHFIRAHSEVHPTISTHPVHEERIRNIREELHRWERYNVAQQ